MPAAPGTSSLAGDLVYVIGQADANTNPAGSVINFDPTVFPAPTTRTITLTSTLELRETAWAGGDPMAPGRHVLTVQRPGFAVRAFQRRWHRRTGLSHLPA